MSEGLCAPGESHERSVKAFLPLQGGGQEGDGVENRAIGALFPLISPIPTPTLEGGGRHVHAIALLCAHRGGTANFPRTQGGSEANAWVVPSSVRKINASKNIDAVGYFYALICHA